jgi:hypothetical protein
MFSRVLNIILIFFSKGSQSVFLLPFLSTYFDHDRKVKLVEKKIKYNLEEKLRIRTVQCGPLITFGVSIRYLPRGYLPIWGIYHLKRH